MNVRKLKSGVAAILVAGLSMSMIACGEKETSSYK